MAELYAAYPTYKYTQFDVQMVAMFVFIFGAFTAAQSIAMGPDIKKATKAAMKIFQIMRTPSKVDTGKAEEYPIKRFVKFALKTHGKEKGQLKRNKKKEKEVYNKLDGVAGEDYIDGVIYEKRPAQIIDVR